MKRKGSIYKAFLYALFIFVLIIAGSRSIRHIWYKAFENKGPRAASSTQRLSEYGYFIANSTSSLMVPNKPPKPIDIFIQPRVLNLTTKGKILLSWIRLPDEYDPHAITGNSLGLSVLSCPKCKIIYPTWQFPIHGQYLIVFLRQDLIDILKTMDLDLPTKLDLKIYGEMNNGTPFEGLETIWITKKN